MSNTEACKFMVGVLYLAATEDCEADLGWAVIDAIDKEQSLKLSSFQSKFQSTKIEHPDIEVNQHPLSNYNQLIPKPQEIIHV